MVECQWRQRIYREPLSFCGIILTNHFSRCIDDREICHSNGAPSWVSVNFGVCTYLMDVRNL